METKETKVLTLSFANGDTTVLRASLTDLRERLTREFEEELGAHERCAVTAAEEDSGEPERAMNAMLGAIGATLATGQYRRVECAFFGGYELCLHSGLV